MSKIIGLFLVVSTFAVSGFAEEDTAANVKAGPSIRPVRTIILPPLIAEKYVFHEVCGCSEKDLHCDLTQKAIKCQDGNKYDSVTKWKVSWDYDYHRADGRCSVDSFRLVVDITTHLPKWMSMQEAPRVLVDKWEVYIRNLMLHEQGHRDRVLDAVSNISNAVADLPPVRWCSDLDRQVRTLSGARLQQLITEQKDYDAVTGHGHAQGVVFP
jgi:predicted secreted Zn-dependent protease